MDERQFHYPILPYEKLSIDLGESLKESKEARKKDRACERKFEDFVQLRGEVLSLAIAVECELDQVIAWYFVPRSPCADDNCHDEQDDRRSKLIDFVQGQESFTVASKTRAVESIMNCIETEPAIRKRNVKKLQAIFAIRNQFAHRRVGIDWQTQEIALWDAKSQRFGFPNYVIDGAGDVKDNNKMQERMPTDFGKAYKRLCQSAITCVHEIWRKVLRLRSMES